MKKFILLIFILSFQISASQNNKHFYLKLSSLEFTPKVIDNENGSKKIVFIDKTINEIFNKYTIYNTNCNSNIMFN